MIWIISAIAVGIIAGMFGYAILAMSAGCDQDREVSDDL